MLKIEKLLIVFINIYDIKKTGKLEINKIISF